MNKIEKSQIIKAEEDLKNAMISSDLDALDELLSLELVFTNHLGHILRKQDDIKAHKSGVVKIDEITPSEQHINIHDGVAIVSVLVYLSGSYNGEVGAGNFRFTRTWVPTKSGKYQVIAGHACVVA